MVKEINGHPPSVRLTWQAIGIIAGVLMTLATIAASIGGAIAQYQHIYSDHAGFASRLGQIEQRQERIELDVAQIKGLLLVPVQLPIAKAPIVLKKK